MATYTLSTAPFKVNPRLAAQAELERLCHHFRIEVKLRWSHGRRFSIYRHRSNEIWMGDKVIGGISWSIGHHFSHALCQHNSTVQSHDDIRFLETMWKVVLVLCNGDPTKFSWYADTNTIFNFGTQRCREFLAQQEENKECIGFTW